MNEIINKFLLAGDKFMPEMTLKQPRFKYSACGSFTKNKGRINNLNKQEIQDMFIKTKQIKLSFQHDVAYGDFKNLNEGTAADKALRDESFNFAPKIQNMIDINAALLQWSISFFAKKTSGETVKNLNISNKELAEELHTNY